MHGRGYRQASTLRNQRTNLQVEAMVNAVFFFFGGGGNCQRENEVQIVVFLCVELMMDIEEVHGKWQLNR